MIDESTCIENDLITTLVSPVKNKCKVEKKTDNEGAWVIYATRKNDKKRLAYEVGHSSDIYSELNRNIDLMFKKGKREQRGYFSDEIAYEWLDKTDFKYRTLISEYEDISIYKINITQFLNYESKKGSLSKIEFGCVKNNVLAEILFAYESNAICWNPGPKEKNEYSRFIEDEKAIAYKLKQLSDNRM